MVWICNDCIIKSIRKPAWTMHLASTAIAAPLNESILQPYLCVRLRTSPAHGVSPRHSPFRLLSIPIAAASLGWYIFHKIWRDTKMYSWLYRFETGELLSSRNSQATRKMTKGHWCKWEILRCLIFFLCFLTKIELYTKTLRIFWYTY